MMADTTILASDGIDKLFVYAKVANEINGLVQDYISNIKYEYKILGHIWDEMNRCFENIPKPVQVPATITNHLSS